MSRRNIRRASFGPEWRNPTLGQMSTWLLGPNPSPRARQRMEARVREARRELNALEEQA